MLGKVEQLNEQLKQEKQKVLILEGQLNTAIISLHSLAEVLHSGHFYIGELRATSFYFF